MRRWIIAVLIFITIIVPVEASAFYPPQTPDSAVVMVPEQPETFSEGLTTVLREAVNYIYPAFRSAISTCFGVVAVVLLTSLVQNLPGSTKAVTDMVSTISIALLLLSKSNALIRLGTDAVAQISEYGRLLLPVMTATVAAQGGTATSAALYAGTAFFDALLSGLIASGIVPMLYIYLCLSVVHAATGEDILSKLAGFAKWAMTWCLKTILYIFTGYMGITGVVGGTADAAAVKAMKLTISGMVPVVGGILADASEAVLVSTGLVKSAIGVYGVVVIIALWIRPFIEIGVQYLMLKLAGGLCSLFGANAPVKLVSRFSGAMGMLLAMTGSVSLLLMVSVVCLMRGIA
jgi:stage III sporulation protein AE